jgi:flagellar motor switch protein FliM
VISPHPGASIVDAGQVTQSPSATSVNRARGRISRRGSGGLQPYDFQRPIKLAREHARLLQIAFETFARGVGTLLTTRLRATSHVSLLAIEQLTIGEYIETLSNPTLISVVTLEPLGGSTLLEIGQSTAMAFLDHMLGGPGGAQPERPLTDIEAPLLRGLLERILNELRQAMEGLVEVNPRLGAIEYGTQFLQAFPPSDLVVVGSFEMRVGEQECIATLCFPFTSILPVLRNHGVGLALTEAELAARRTAHENISEGLTSAPIDVTVRFRPVRMRSDDIVGLRPGDVVPLAHPVTLPLAVTVNDTTFAYAVPGNQGSRLACLVVPAPKEDQRP